MGDDVPSEPPPEPFDVLREDQFFAAWDENSPDEGDLVRAAKAVLDQDGPEGYAEMERERAMRRLALLQVVAPYFANGAPNWEVVFEVLTPSDRAEVEQLLGNDSLGELLS